MMLISLVGAALAAGMTHTFEVAGGQFLLDKKPFQILAGEIHPARVPHQLWRQRIRMAKAMGLNTISAYVFWNFHEPEPNRFDFKGDHDIAGFLRICKEEGMYAILRPGPYCCAEWEFGGFPYWLLRDPKLVVRANNPAFLAAARHYLARLAKETAPFQVTHGGTILMVQVENEYGSYGKDKAYMGKVRDILRDVGYDVPLYVAEGSSQLADAWIPGTVAGANGAGWPDVKRTVDKYTPGGPYFVPEFYPGWLDHWGEPKSQTDGDIDGFRKLVENGASVSMYMFHGGTSFGFYNGANYGGHYQPDLTSYDYDSPLNEYGKPNSKFFAFRQVIEDVTHTSLPPVPDGPRTIAIPAIELHEAGSLLGSLPAPVHSDQVLTMEDLGQDYGYVLYRTTVPHAGAARLVLHDLRDYAVVMVDGKVVATLDRRHKDKACTITAAAGSRLDLLVENSGRINFGGLLPDNLHGITKEVRLDDKPLTGWEIYSLPMREPSRLKLDGKPSGPSLYRGTFTVSEIGETFLDLRGWTKGAVWVNGHALGRYWWIGPQQTLYLPSVWLKKGENEITVFDLAGRDKPSIQGLSEPILTDLRAEPTPPRPKRADIDPATVLSETARVQAADLVPGAAAQSFTFSPRAGRYLALEVVSTFANEDYSSLSEIELIGADGKPLDRSAWRVAYVDSEETAQEDGKAENAIDGDPDTIWHTVWSVNHSGLPHRLIIDLGASITAHGVRLLPRQDSKSGRLKSFRVYLLP